MLSMFFLHIATDYTMALMAWPVSIMQPEKERGDGHLHEPRECIRAAIPGL